MVVASEGKLVDIIPKGECALPVPNQIGCLVLPRIYLYYINALIRILGCNLGVVRILYSILSLTYGH